MAPRHRRDGPRLGVFIGAIALMLLASCATGMPPADTLPKGTLVVDTAEGGKTLQVEIAETGDARAHGLMERRSLAPDAGMAFLFPESNREGFWMRNTLIPLSIAFWDESGRIIEIFDMQPCPADPCPTYTPATSYVGAVETNQGYFEEHHVEVGDTVALSR
jgi:uncharacterized membrane protein (UPF0127 family)